MTEREWIFRVVDNFYAKVKVDVLIGYHFWRITDFDIHIPRIASFWDIQLLGTTDRTLSHPFDMLGIHEPLKIKYGELGRWLVLFKKTLNEETEKYPEFTYLRERWEERLKFFEGVFSRFFGL